MPDSGIRLKFQTWRRRRSAAVRELVQELTDDKGLEKAERKRLQIEHAPHLSREAKVIKLGDKIANIRDVIEHPPTDWPLERRLVYLD